MKSLTKPAIAITVLLLCSKILGFVREICLAYKFGTSYIVDVYSVCITLPGVLFAIYAYGCSDAYIPVCARARDENARKQFLNSALTILIIGAFIISIICFYLRGTISNILAPGYAEEARNLLKSFIGIISISFPFMTMFSLFSAHLQFHEDFFGPCFCDFIIINVVVICSIMLATKNDPLVLIYGYVISHIVATSALWIYGRYRHNLRYAPSLNCQETGLIVSLFKLSIPLGASRLINQLNNVVDQIFASLLGEGVTSALSYANRIQLIFYSLTTSIFLSVSYPRMNRCFADGDQETGMYYVRKAMMLAAYISIPVTCGLFVFAAPIISFLFERGSFNAESTVLTAGCLAAYALGIPFYALREIASRALGSNLKQKKILKNTVVFVITNILLNLVLYRPLGHIGLALATSLSSLLVSVLALLDLRKIGLSMFQRGQTRDFVKIILVTAVSILISVVTYRVLLPRGGNTVALLCAGGGAVVVYGVGSVVTRMDIFLWFYARLPKTLQKIPWLNV